MFRDNFEIVTLVALDQNDKTTELVAKLRAEYDHIYAQVKSHLKGQSRPNINYLLEGLELMTLFYFDPHYEEKIEERFQGQTQKPDRARYMSSATKCRLSARNVFIKTALALNLPISPELQKWFDNDKFSTRLALSRTQSFNQSETAVCDAIKERVRTLVSRSLSELLLNGLVTESDIDKLISKTARATTISNFSEATLKSYAHRAALNLRTSKLRHFDSTQRRIILNQAKANNAIIKSANDAILQYEKDEAIAEYQLHQEMLGKQDPRFIKYLEILFYTIFEGENDQQLQARYPDTSRELRDQRRKKARILLLSNCNISDNLKKFLGKRTHNNGVGFQSGYAKRKS